MLFLYILAVICSSILPKALQTQGIVIVGSKKCKFTKEIVDWMNKNNKHYTLAYIEDDKELLRYIIDEFKGGVPEVFEDGVALGSGQQYMEKQNEISTKEHNSLLNSNLLVKYQSIKTRQQVLEDAKLVGRTFSEDEMSDLERIGIMADYDMFKIKNGNELIASVSCKKKNYYKKTFFLWREFIEEIPAVEIYSLWVSDKYRGRGIARKLLSKAVKCIRNEYNYGNDFIIGLHLNSDDGCMNVSFALYYSLNFRKGMFVQYGPDDLRGCYERIHTLHDPVSIILGKAHCTGKGRYFAMYTTYNQILFNNPIANKNLFQIGERLRSILKKRKEIEY